MVKKKQADKPPEEFEDIKWCNKCREWKGARHFSKSSRLKDHGLSVDCKQCGRARWEKFYAKQKLANRHPPTTGSKLCTKCFATKPVGEFYKKPSSACGRESQCKACKENHRKERRDNDRKKRLISQTG